MLVQIENSNQVFSGVTTVTTAGSEQVLFPNQTIKSVTIKALSTNTGIIYVGGSSLVSSANGFPLSASDTVSLDVSNTNAVWIDSSINNQSVAWISVW